MNPCTDSLVASKGSVASRTADRPFGVAAESASACGYIQRSIKSAYANRSLLIDVKTRIEFAVHRKLGNWKIDIV